MNKGEMKLIEGVLSAHLESKDHVRRSSSIQSVRSTRSPGGHLNCTVDRSPSPVISRQAALHSNTWDVFLIYSHLTYIQYETAEKA